MVSHLVVRVRVMRLRFDEMRTGGGVVLEKSVGNEAFGIATVGRTVNFV